MAKVIRYFQLNYFSFFISLVALGISIFGYIHNVRSPILVLTGYAECIGGGRTSDLVPQGAERANDSPKAKINLGSANQVPKTISVNLLLENRGSGPATDINVSVLPFGNSNPSIHLSPAFPFQLNKIQERITIHLPAMKAGDQVKIDIMDPGGERNVTFYAMVNGKLSRVYYATAVCKEGSTTPQAVLPISWRPECE